MTDEFDTKIAARIEKHKAEQTAQLQKQRDKLVPKLRKNGIESIIFEYTGYGDEGNLEAIVFIPAMNAPKNTSEVEKTLWSVLALHFPGFETDEGGYGKMTWNITTDRIKVEHEQNVVHTNSSVVEEI